MSYVRIWVHLVFSTKNRQPFLTKEIREKLYMHIKENCKKKAIFLQVINGYSEHLHCLISLGKEQSISKVAQLIKGESALWINKEKLTEERFMWQDDYFANSVSESQVKKVLNYINNQEQHHSKKTFNDEVDEFMKIYSWKNIV